MKAFGECWRAAGLLLGALSITHCGGGQYPSSTPDGTGTTPGTPVGSVTAAEQAPAECRFANPDDQLADDLALQDCIARDSVVQLRSGEHGYILARGLEILGQQGVTLRGQHAAPARLIADPSLASFMLKAFGVSSFTLEHLIIDGNRLRRSFRCNDGGVRPSNLYIIGDDVRITHVESTGSLCGTGMGVSGSRLSITDNWVHDNGFTNADPGRGTEQWSDGITITDCRDGLVARNLIEDSTDIGLVLAGSRNCHVTDNRIAQHTRKAFAGLGVQNFGDASDPNQGDHSGSVFSGNIIESEPDMLDYGISLGIHTWNPGLVTANARVTGNRVTGAIINLSLDGLADSEVMDNVLSAPSRGTLQITPRCEGVSANMAFAHIHGICLQETDGIGLVTDQGIPACRHEGDACTVLEQLPENCPSRPRWQLRCRAAHEYQH